ncbi:hypothetical protein ACIA8I_41255 [Streptomyces rishiriensis]|uniref:hypothetical protein n=1 Tax=Streptomyces rishiriensis TaxID=68264 RepID=UPI0037BB77A1
MKDVAEAKMIWASRTGSYNHNEIVVPIDLDAEVDGSLEPGFVAGPLTTNHNEIVISG